VVAVPFRVSAQQPGDGREQPDAEHDGDTAIGRAPTDRRYGEHGQERKYRLADGEAECRQRDGPPAPGVEVTGHAGDRHVTHEPLPGLAQQEDSEDQHDRPGDEGHERAGGDQQDADDGGVDAQIDAIDEPAGRRQQQRAAEGSHHVDGAPCRVAETECVLHARSEDADEVGLAEAG
jgi:hypothetical protein